MNDLLPEHLIGEIDQSELFLRVTKNATDDMEKISQSMTFITLAANTLRDMSCGIAEEELGYLEDTLASLQHMVEEITAGNTA